MSKAIYTGVNNKARKAPKLYVGVNNLATKVKKGYIGANGVARLFYTAFGDLPEGYTRLQYITNPGKAYLDLPGPWNMQSNLNRNINFDFQILEEGKTSVARYMLHSYGDDSNRAQPFDLFFGFEDTNNQGHFDVSTRAGPSASAQYTRLNMGNYTIYDRFVLNMFAGTAKLNNISSYLKNSISTTGGIRIFSLSVPDKINFYSFSVEMNKEPECLLIPCINPSGKVGVYEAVWKRFYSSASEIEFVAGPAV